MHKDIRHHALVALVITCFSSFGFAEWNSKNKVELGMTDNAVLTDENRESDLFLSLGSRNIFTSNEHTLGVRLGYKDYSKVNSNDAFSWGLSDTLKCFTSSACKLELKGQEYVSGEPMTTDSSFSNYALALDLTKTKQLNARQSLDFVSLYEAKRFYSLNRTDHLMSQNIIFGHDTGSLIYLEAMAEFGLNISSSSEYSSYYFLFSGVADYTLSNRWNLSAEMGLKQMTFLSRDLTTQTEITRRNGRTVSLTDSSKELYSSIFINADANYSLTEDSSLGLSFQAYRQTSKSGYQNYIENQIIAKGQINF